MDGGLHGVNLLGRNGRVAAFERLSMLGKILVGGRTQIFGIRCDLRVVVLVAIGAPLLVCFSVDGDRRQIAVDGGLFYIRDTRILHRLLDGRLRRNVVAIHADAFCVLLVLRSVAAHLELFEGFLRLLLWLLVFTLLTILGGWLLGLVNEPAQIDRCRRICRVGVEVGTARMAEWVGLQIATQAGVVVAEA